MDSEHNAIHQCLHGRRPDEIRRLILTASGGPFRDLSPEQLRDVGPDAALRHPTWQMGRKITIDSATLMNKGLEVIEAHWLFDTPAERIDVVVHPQSIVHSMVELNDGSVIAQLGVTDMRLPIQYACSYPERWDAALPQPGSGQGRAGWSSTSPRTIGFPAWAWPTAPCAPAARVPVVLNAANEVAVAAFLEGRLGFTSIPAVIERTMNAHQAESVSTRGTHPARGRLGPRPRRGFCRRVRIDRLRYRA